MQEKQKKRRSLLAIFVIAVLAMQIVLPSMVFAAPVSEAPQTTSFNISFNSDGTANITGYKFKEDPTYTSVTIPSKINGTKIVGISEGAFRGSYYLQYINIPDTVREIGKDGFSDCISLKEITIPGSVSKIGPFAFMSCQSLETVYILYGVQSIGDGAFADCSSLTTVAISPSTTQMEDKIFDESDTVKVQANPDSVAGNFTGYEGKVDSTEMPSDCPSAYKYVVDENTGEVIIEGYVGTSTTPVIPNKLNNADVTGIGDGAFQDQPITQVTLPDTLKTIGANAFAGTKLTIVEIPSTVTGIGDGAFDDTSSITLKGDTSAIDDYLSNSKFIQFVPWGPGRTKYHEMTVESSPALGGTILQGRSKEYKEGTIITLEAKPTTPANIGSADKGTYLFAGWKVKSNVTVENGEPIDSLIAAPNLSKTTLTMPSYDITVTATYGLLPPEPLIIRNGVVLSYTGYPDARNKLVIEPTWREQIGGTSQTVHTVGAYSKDGNYGITFLDSNNLKELELPYTITTILPTVFNQSYSLESIIVAKDNANFETQDGVLFNKGKTKLLAYPANKPGSSYKVPDTVKEIGEYAFYNNRNLESIDLNKVEKINNNAFESASKLSEITSFGNVTYIGSFAFAYAPKLNNVNIPKEVSYLGTYAFYNCRSLQTVLWDADSLIKSIPSYAFASCPITRIVLPNGVETVNGYAFAYCNSLNAVSISRTITTLSSDAFYGSNNLAAIEVEEENPNYSSIDGVLFNKGATVLMTYPIAKTEPDASYVVPETVTTIGDGAFGYAKFSNIDTSNVTIIGSNAFSNSNIKAIDLQNVTQIGNDAFSYCNGLEEVTWPAAAQSVSMYTFRYCVNLKKVVIPDTVTSINSYAFNGCSKLVDIVLPESLESIGQYAFYGCNSISDLKLPSKLKSIGSYAFYGCSSIPEINLPDSLTSIGSYAFSSCSGLQSITIPANITSLGSSVFSSCTGLKEATVEAASVPSYAFSGCSNISSVTLSDNVKTIGQFAFQSCVKLTEISIPAASINSYAFNSCSGLENVTLQNTVNLIGEKAFSGCSKLTAINIPSSVTAIGLEAFNQCEGLESITVDENNQNYASADGVLHDKGVTNLICYPQSKAGETYSTAETVTKISDYAFESANNLTEVNFTNDVANIGHSVFINASKISKIIINNKDAEFVTIETYPVKTMFYGISDSLLNKLVVYGYLGSTAEKEVFIYTVKGIKFMALDAVTKGLVIQKIQKNSNQRTVDNLPLDENTWLGEVVGYQVPTDALNTEEAKKVVVPSLITNETEGLEDLVIKDENGADITLADGERIVVSSIGKHALWYPGANSSSEGKTEETFVRAITSIVLPQTITDIKINAFEDCTGLNNFIIPPSVKNIHAYAFRNCTALTEITIPENVVMLGEDKLLDELSKTESHTSAFYGCTNLKKINVDSKNIKYASVDGVLMNYDKNKIYEVPNGFIGNVEGVTDHYIIPEGIETIGSSAFVGCKLRQVDFPKSIKHVGVNAFNGVLTKPNSVVNFKEEPENALDIDNGAFEDCTGLVRVVLSPELERIGDQAFKGCTSLLNFEIPDTSEEYRSVDGILMTYSVTGSNNTESYAIYLYPEGRTESSYIVPDSIPVRQIYKGAFQDNKHLESIALSDTVQLIQESAFRNCTNLKDISWSKTIQEIGPLAFTNTAFKNIVLPGTILKIGQEAFSGCELLSADVYSPNADIGVDAFKGHSDSFVLRGLKDSTTQNYAADNNLVFELLSGTDVVKYNVTVSDSIKNGTVTVDKQTAIYKEVVNVIVVPAEGYRLVEGSLKYNGIAISADSKSFEMPEEDAVITADFELIPENENTPNSAVNPAQQSDDSTEGDSGQQAPSQSEPDSNKDEPSSEF